MIPNPHQQLMYSPSQSSLVHHKPLKCLTNCYMYKCVLITIKCMCINGYGYPFWVINDLICMFGLKKFLYLPIVSPNKPSRFWILIHSNCQNNAHREKHFNGQAFKGTVLRLFHTALNCWGGGPRFESDIHHTEKRRTQIYKSLSV